MKKTIRVLLVMGTICLVLPQTAPAGKGFMGGKGDIVVEEEPAGDGGMPGTVEGPLNDNMSTSGALFGDLYKILRYQGGESYIKYVFSYDDVGRVTGFAEEPSATAIGGEPVLSHAPGYYAAEVMVGEEVTYELAQAPYPSQCVQPVADPAKWGDIDGVTGLSDNRLPLVISYDATWTRSECAVGELVGPPVVDQLTGEITFNVNEYFIPPCADVENKPEQCTWEGVVYCYGVKWTELVDEVHFGRLNLSRAPEAVLQAAFDEAISNINGARLIERDSAGRLLLTTDIYEEIVSSVDGVCGYSYVETVTKAIDSPLENLALYVKLMQDGHLVTPGNEREPLDRSEYGGIPLWKMLELEDGPSADLRPTVEIAKLEAFYPELVDVTSETYYTYYVCLDAQGGVVDPCMIWSDDVMQPELEGNWVLDPEVVSRELQVAAICPSGIDCDGPFTGLAQDNPAYAADAADLEFAAAFLAAAAPKYESIGPDLVVYLNSILGVNKVVGEGYSKDGVWVDFSLFPEYFDYKAITGYKREVSFNARSQPTILIKDTPGIWLETKVQLMDYVQFQNFGFNLETGSSAPAEIDFMGFTQMADDNLSTIKLIHDYAPPSAGE